MTGIQQIDANPCASTILSAEIRSRSLRLAGGGGTPARGVLLRGTIEHRILPHLLSLHPPQAIGVVTEADVLALARRAVAEDGAPMFVALEEMLAAGMSVEALCLDLLAPAARQLGILWEQDEYHFTEVTAGVARLQQALRRLLPAVQANVRYSHSLPRILMVPVPGEQHRFGLAMAADFFHRAGWTVCSGMSPGLDALLGLVRTRRFDVVGFSASCERHVPMLVRALRGVREASCNTQVVTMVGGPLFAMHPEIGIQLGADVMATDGALAPAQAAISLRGRREHPKSADRPAGFPARLMALGEPRHSDRSAHFHVDGDSASDSRRGEHRENRAGRR